MGIKDFYKFINTKHSDCFKPVHFSTFKYKCIAIDMMNLLYIHKARNSRDWMKNVLIFLKKLQNYYVHPVCIFDGKSHPLKYQTIQKRKDERNKGLARISSVKESLENYKTSKHIDDLLRNFIRNKPEFVSRLNPDTLIIDRIEEYIQKQINNYSLYFSSDDIKNIKELISGMGIKVITAKYDGEALCSYLSKIGKVEAVVTNDSDVFFFGCKSVICKFVDDGGLLLTIDSILEKMEIDYEQFIDLCILCGTDFNESTKGYGFIRSLALIQKYKTLENIKNLKDEVQAFKEINISLELMNEIKNMSNPNGYEILGQEGQEGPESSLIYENLFNIEPDYIKLDQLLFKNQIQLEINFFNYHYSDNIIVI